MKYVPDLILCGLVWWWIIANGWFLPAVAFCLALYWLIFGGWVSAYSAYSVDMACRAKGKGSEAGPIFYIAVFIFFLAYLVASAIIVVEIFKGG